VHDDEASHRRGQRGTDALCGDDGPLHVLHETL
jgi:hypothetical protein